MDVETLRHVIDQNELKKEQPNAPKISFAFRELEPEKINNSLIYQCKNFLFISL